LGRLLQSYMWYICVMPQLHCYVPKELAEKLRERAEREGLSLSRLLARVLDREVDDWPEGFFEKVAGGWKGEPPVRPEQDPWEDRARLGGE
jgi:hypothetical protein